MNNTQEYTIKASPELMRLLSSGLYQNKILAVIRELASNAIDAVSDNSGKVVMKLYGDKEKGYWFQVSDTGPGLTADETITLMSTYGNTTKNNVYDKIGQFGVGSKSPFAYSEEFYIKSSKNGSTHFFKCYKDEQGIPFIKHLKTEKSNECGLDFRIKISKNDITDFFLQRMLFTIYQYKDTPLEFEIDLDVTLKNLPYFVNWSTSHTKNKNNTIHINHRLQPQLPYPKHDVIPKYQYTSILNIQISKIVEEFQNQHPHLSSFDCNQSMRNHIMDIKPWGEFISSGSSDHIILKVGNIEYFLEIDQNIDVEFRSLIPGRIVFVVGPKEITLTGSRESIEKTKSNYNIIQEKIKKFEDVLRQLGGHSKSIIDRLSEDDKDAYDFIDLIRVSNIADSCVMYDVNADLRKIFKNEFDIKYRPNIYFENNKFNDIVINLRSTLENKGNAIMRYDHYAKKPVPVDTLGMSDRKTKQCIFCMFTRRKADFEEIYKKYPTEHIYYIPSDDVTSILQMKKWIAEFSQVKWIKNRMVVLNPEDADKFKRTYKRSESKKTANFASIYVKNEHGEVQRKDEFDFNAKTIYFIKHRQNIHILYEFDPEHDNDIKIDSGISPQSTYFGSATVHDYGDFFEKSKTVKLLNEIGCNQAIVFSNKKTAIKFLKANNIKVSVTKQLEEHYKQIILEQPLLIPLHKLFKNNRDASSLFEYSGNITFNEFMNTVSMIDKEYSDIFRIFRKYFTNFHYTKTKKIVENLMKNETCDPSLFEHQFIRLASFMSYYHNNLHNLPNFIECWNLFELFNGHIEADISKDIIDKINIFKGEKIGLPRNQTESS